MDLDAFYAAYRGDGRARPAYEPAMMVALLLYAYARGVRSSRAIERACIEDVAYRVIAAQHKPDHATHRALCRASPGRAGGRVRIGAWPVRQAGLVGVNVVAIDGSKVSANASREATVDYERLAREVLEEAQEIDAEEDDALRRAARGRVAAGAGDLDGPQGWLADAKRWLDDQRAEQAAPIPRDRPKRVKEAKRRLDEELLDRDAAPTRPMSATGPRA